MTDQAENIRAIEEYFGRTVATTDEAIKIKDDFLRYVAGLTDWEKNFESGIYDRVRNLKLAFNRANATTPEEKEAVEEQALRGMSSEEMRGEADRRLSTGEYAPRPTTSERSADAFAEVRNLLLVGGAAWIAWKLLKNR